VTLLLWKRASYKRRATFNYFYLHLSLSKWKNFGLAFFWITYKISGSTERAAEGKYPAVHGANTGAYPLQHLPFMGYIP